MAQLYCYDGHGLWPLVILFGYDADGAPRHGEYCKWVAEGSDEVKWIPTGPSLVSIETIEEATLESITTGPLREKARGSIIYGEVPIDSHFGLATARFVAAKKKMDDLWAQATGQVLPTTTSPTPFAPPPVEPVFDPADENKDGIVTKQERKAYQRKLEGGN